MKKERIKQLCKEKGMMESSLFVEWFSRRFPNESDRITSYVNEWIDRFMSDNPIGYMDNESKIIYLRLGGK